MTRKRFAAAILAVSLTCGLFSSCGSSNESNDTASGGAAVTGAVEPGAINTNHNNKTQNGNSISNSNTKTDGFATEAYVDDAAEAYDAAIEPYYPPYIEPGSGEEYTEITENGFVSVSEQPLLTFPEYSAFPEPGVRRVRATIPVGQSQCSGQ